MATRRVYVNGESLVYVKGPAGSPIANLTELGLAQNQVVIGMQFNHDAVMADAWGKAPFEIQWKLASVTVQMDLIHFDPDVLEVVNSLSMANPAGVPGRMGRAGALMGNNLPSGAAGNCFVRLNIASPVGQRPWRLFSCYIPGGTEQWPLGAEKSVVPINWTCIPYTGDPWRGGLGAQDYPLFDHTLDS